MKKKLLFILSLLSIISYSQTIRLDSIKNTDNTIKITFIYNSANVNIGYEHFEINTDGETWNKTKEIALSYNSDNLVASENYYNWNGSQLIDDEKIEYTYNSDLSINTKNYSRWNTTSNNWELTSDEQYNYISGTLTEVVNNDYYYNKLYKYNYTYNGSELIRIEKIKWDDNNNDWNETFLWGKKEYTYDNSSNLIEFLEYYDNDSGVLDIADFKIEYHYDYNYTISDLILPFKFNQLDFSLPFRNNEIINCEFFNYENSNWESSLNLTYFYTDTALSTNNISTKDYTVFPNPTTNQVKFDIADFEKIEIYDITGKLITKTKINIVNMENVPNGTYLYRIQKGNEIINGKIIKK